MALKATDSGDFTPAPEGTHVARCIRVVDLGTQPGSQQFPEPKHKVLFVWELPNELEEYEGQQLPRIVSKRYTVSLHRNAVLRHDLESWRGRSFTEQELGGFALKAVLGVPCMISVVHENGYANVKTVTGCPRGTNVPAAHHPLVHYEIEEGESPTFRSFGTKLQERIRKAPEWPGNRHDPEDHAPEDPPFHDDDIPF